MTSFHSQLTTSVAHFAASYWRLMYMTTCSSAIELHERVLFE
jgi:hypothetical protein